MAARVLVPLGRATYTSTDATTPPFGIQGIQCSIATSVDSSNSAARCPKDTGRCGFSTLTGGVDYAPSSTLEWWHMPPAVEHPKRLIYVGIRIFTGRHSLSFKTYARSSRVHLRYREEALDCIDIRQVAGDSSLAPKRMADWPTSFMELGLLYDALQALQRSRLHGAVSKIVHTDTRT